MARCIGKTKRGKPCKGAAEGGGWNTCPQHRWQDPYIKPVKTTRIVGL